MKVSLKNTIAIIFIVLFAGTLYVLTLRGNAGNPLPDTAKLWDGSTNPFELSPERGRFAHVMELGESGDYPLSKDLADFVYPDVGYYAGKFYGFFAPGIAYMALPFYLVGKTYGLSQVFTYGFISFVSILALIFLFKIGREVFALPVWASLFAALTFAFGSTAWSYAITLYQHHVTTFFIISGFYAAWRYAKRTPWSWLWGFVTWTNYGLAILIDYPNGILYAPVMVYFFFMSLKTHRLERGIRIGFRSAFIGTAALFILIGVVHMIFNTTYFGGWNHPAGTLVGYKAIIENKIMEQPDPEAALAKIARQKSNVVQFFREENFPNGMSVLFVSTDRGLFFFGPIFILAFIGLLRRIKGASPEIMTLIGLVVTHIFLYASWGDPWGGWAYGTRYMIPTMSILSLFLADWLVARPRALWKRLLACGLFLYSSAIALLGALTTNAVPPKSEALALHGKWNYVLNMDFFWANQSGSYVYKTYLASFMPLSDYAIILYAAVICGALILLFIMPFYEHGD